MIKEVGIPNIITRDNLVLIKKCIERPTKIRPNVIFEIIVLILSLTGPELSRDTSIVILGFDFSNLLIIF